MKGHVFNRLTTAIAPTKTIKSSHKPSNNITETHIISLIHSSNSTKQLRQIHAQIILHNLFASSRITTQLISSASLHKSTDYALSIFGHFTPKNLHIFNVLIRGLAENSHFQSCISHFVFMLRLSVRPNRLTYPFVSKSVASLSLLSLGRGLHCLIVKSGVEYDAFVRVHLADMYVQLGKTRGAFKVFDETPEKNKSESVLLWNVLINGCSKIGYLRKAVELFGMMPKKNVASWVSLIDGFMRKGDLKKAGELFEQMPEKGVVSWTAMINGFSQNGEAEKALAMFFQMLDAGVRANDFTVVSALSACAKVGALEAGVRVHNYISCNDFGLKGAIGTALVDMYAKCGNIEAASLVFGETKEKDLLTWTAMIWGLAIHGRYEQAIQYFKKMMYSGTEPDGTVFLAILTACWYSGQVKLALNFFDSMRFDYFIEPSVKHHTVVVNLLSRVGQQKGDGRTWRE
ncbi:pentatricopeptide repeat-containing protein At1g04840 isoform X3 [Citrus sinensis]|uniref:pentatricopeptide repeat-containing protein At1g04840 isoform X3 n=1 Tax=Citrus sinensis TaxID=2711 RepID=UPI002278888A|nr:pentatricopeptide repeat-containing protein At1g04840 isoform X3 [Citrus sinensis]